jgi:hypothetical protein
MLGKQENCEATKKIDAIFLAEGKEKKIKPVAKK